MTTVRQPFRFISVVVALLLAACSPRSDVTMPSPGSSRPSPTQTGPAEPDPVRIAAVGDVGEANPTQAAIAMAILTEHRNRKLDALLVLGDIVYPSGDPSLFDERFWNAFGPLSEAGIQILPVLGNHDIQTDRAGMMSRLQMAAPYYERIIGDVQLLGLDTSSARMGDEQAGWLDDRLTMQGPRWRVPFMHVSPYSSGMHGNHPGLQTVLGPLLQRHGVPIVLAAHDHNYERTRPIDGTIYVITGGGCCPRRIDPGALTDASSSEAHFVILEFSAGSIDLRALTPDLRLLDELALPWVGSRTPATVP